MYVDTATYVRSGKKHKRYLLRESYREEGKVKKRTIASLCSLSEEEIKAIKLALKHKSDLSNLTNLQSIESSQGKSFGAILLIQKIAQDLGITKALGSSKEGKLALWQIMGRILFQGSRLRLVRALDVHAAQELLSMGEVTAKKLYNNLSWIENKQNDIEQKLQDNRDIKTNLYLYDVTSSYLEGDCNELAEYGYNRDKKRGKKQIVIGLLTDSNGYPVAVRIFKGNTSDSKTVSDQIKLLQDEFGVKKLTLVGDRAMFNKDQIDNLPEDFSYITAIGKQQIKKLIKEDTIQLSLFDQNLQEVETEDKRYILRCNTVRKQEISNTRNEKIDSIKSLIKDKNKYLSTHNKANPEIALRDIKARAVKLVVDKFINFTIDDRVINYSIEMDSLNEAEELDGCYCLITNIASSEADKDTIHARYKDLAMVESAFRTMKQSHLEIRPVFVRREDRTKAHVFVTMLSYMIERKLSEYWKDLQITTVEGIDALTTLTTNIIKISDITINKVTTPNALCKNLLDSAGVVLPNQIGRVSTDKSLI